MAEMIRPNEDLNESEQELHAELIAKNIFNVTMIGAVAFFLACGKVLFIG